MTKAVSFKVAETEDDYALAHRLMRLEDVPEQVLGFPTIMCFEWNDELEDDELIGICGTYIQDHLIIAGPLTLKRDRRRVFTALRIAEFYENTMRKLGIISFIFSAEKGSIMDEACTRYTPGMKPYAEEGDRRFYIRNLKHPMGIRDGQ